MYVNLDVLKTYAEGDPDFLKEMIDKFNKEMPQVLDNQQKALEEKNWPLLQQISHKMIGTTGVFYITPVTPILQKIEQICLNQPDKDTLTPMVKEVRKICEFAMQELEAEKNNF